MKAETGKTDVVFFKVLKHFFLKNLQHCTYKGLHATHFIILPIDKSSLTLALIENHRRQSEKCKPLQKHITRVKKHVYVKP